MARSVPGRGVEGMARGREHHRGRHLPPDLQSACPAGHRSASSWPQRSRRRQGRRRRLGSIRRPRRPPPPRRFVTSAVKRGVNLIKITDLTGHKSLEMLSYSRDAERSPARLVQDCSERTLMGTCSNSATEDPILVFDAFGPIGFVMKFTADNWEW